MLYLKNGKFYTCKGECGVATLGTCADTAIYVLLSAIDRRRRFLTETNFVYRSELNRMGSFHPPSVVACHGRCVAKHGIYWDYDDRLQK